MAIDFASYFSSIDVNAILEAIKSYPLTPNEITFAVVFGFVGFLIGFLVRIYQDSLKERRHSKEKHFEAIKGILAVWLEMIKSYQPYSYKPDNVRFLGAKMKYDALNQQLFSDIIDNHFQELKMPKESFKVAESVMQEKATAVENDLRLRYALEEVSGVAVCAFYIVPLTQQTWPRVVKGMLFSASLRLAKGNDASLKMLVGELANSHPQQRGEDIRKAFGVLEEQKKALVTEIEKAMAATSLKGKCAFR